MANTNFGLLTDEQKTAWSLDFWNQARNMSFVNKFLGKDSNSVIQHIDELKRSEKGARAVLTLIADLEGDGVAGDRTLKGNEERGISHDRVIRIDQMRHAQKNEGRMADQKSIVNFRSTARDLLAYWISDRIDQMAFLTMSGVNYSLHNSGRARTGSDMPHLEFAADVVPPTDLRRGRWNNTTKDFAVGGASSDVTTADTPAWEMFIQLKAFAQTQYMRPVRGEGNTALYHAFLTPQAMAKLKLDPTYMANVRHAQSRSNSNPLFTGNSVEIDGIMLHEFRHVFHTDNSPAGSKWGGGGDVNGTQVLFCGAQALGMADIGNPSWDEEPDDYNNQQGISIGKMVGLLKPQFPSIYANNTVQDFGVISAYVAH